MREGRDLEKLVAAVEKAASRDSSVRIESPYIATDRVTGAPREHDVAIFVTQHHHQIIIALECRDRSRNVTVPEVEGFFSKCQDTNIHKGGIVSSKGFAEDAILKAKHLGVGCYTLEQAQDISWLKMTTITSYSSRVISNHWMMIPHVTTPKKPEKFHIEDSAGNPVPLAHFGFNTTRELRKQEDEFWHRPGIHRFSYRFIMEGYTLCDDDTGERFPLKHANVLVDVEVSLSNAPITKWIYHDEILGANVIEAGIAPIVTDRIAGDLMFVSGANGINVSFRPEPPHKQT